MNLRNKIPSAQSLFAFEAAARTLNFTDAGRTLNVTQPAISKSIAALETHLGCLLFERHKSGLQLSPEGEILNSAVKLSFGALENAIDQISQTKRGKNEIRLSLSTAFLSHWLMPQLEDLKQALPGISLGFELDIGEMRGPVAPADLGLRHELEVNENEVAAPMSQEWIIALASPSYLARNGMLNAPKPGAEHSLVKLAQPRISWAQFLAETRQEIPADVPKFRVPDYSIVIQSALNGKGVALGFASTTSYLISQGLLRPALPRSWKTGYSYTMTCPPLSSSKPHVQQLLRWVSEQSRQQFALLENLVE